MKRLLTNFLLIAVTLLLASSMAFANEALDEAPVPMPSPEESLVPLPLPEVNPAPSPLPYQEPPPVPVEEAPQEPSNT